MHFLSNKYQNKFFLPGVINEVSFAKSNIYGYPCLVSIMCYNLKVSIANMPFMREHRDKNEINWIPIKIIKF